MERLKIKYWLDTEFIELPERIVTRPVIKVMPGGKMETVVLPATIILLSIGLVCEDGREYYAVNTEADCSEASEWVKENVLMKMPEYNKSYNDLKQRGANDLKKTIKDIKKEVLHFCGQHNNVTEQCEFWAYFADYDWVVFCWIFGSMMDLPKGFPMYCKDIKQLLEQDFAVYLGQDDVTNKEWMEKNCPKPEGEHNALVDARWNRDTFNKIIRFRDERMYLKFSQIPLSKLKAYFNV